MSVWTTPITDRTQSDITAKNDKAKIGKEFHNRVEGNTEYIKDSASALGYDFDITVKTDWDYHDIKDRDDDDRILGNIQTMIDACPSPSGMPSLPPDMRLLTYEEANDIEQILDTMNGMCGASTAWALTANFTAGDYRVRQWLERG